MKKTLLFIIIGLLIAVAAWLFVFSGSDDNSQADIVELQDFPARFDESGPTTAPAQYESEFNNLSFTYPNNWNVTESADNSEESQLLTVESPLDENEFYFCLDVFVVNSESDANFDVFDTSVLTANELASGRNSIIYQVDGLDGLQWGASDDAVNVGDDEFVNEIVGESGNRMQLYGRFNCRDTQTADISTEEFQNARWYHEARSIVESLSF